MLGLVFILGGGFVTIMVCAIMPSTTGSGYTSHQFVRQDFQNYTGWPSGFAFLTGMLNGAFAMGIPDFTSHLSEEIPNPRKNVPLAILAQISIEFITAILYPIAIFYSINSLDDILKSEVLFPLATVYAQATNSRGGAFGLLISSYFPSGVLLLAVILQQAVCSGR